MKPDVQLQQLVLDELRANPSTTAAAIGVEVSNGIVTLAGQVENLAQKLSAECVAQRVAGVRGVVVEIDVTLPGSSRRSDAELAQAAIHALDWNASVPKGAVIVSVDKAWITLSGEVDRAYQRAAALGAIHTLIGVAGVRNKISLRAQPVDPHSVRKRILEAMHRQAKHDADAISVEVDGTTVTLAGVVDSHSERVAARNAAWTAHGVRHVVDRIDVAGSETPFLGV